MLLIDIHELDVVLAQAVALAALKHQVHNVRCILRLQCQDVFVLGASQHLHQRAEVDAEGNVAVTAEGGEGLGFEHHGDEGDVRVIHSLEGNTGVIAVEVAVLNQIFDGINDLELCFSLV